MTWVDWVDIFFTGLAVIAVAINIYVIYQRRKGGRP